MVYNSIDLFCGCGGMTQGLIDAGYKVVAAIEIDEYASKTYRANHDKNGVRLIQDDIRNVRPEQIEELLKGEPLHLLAGCPPCQGFSSIRRKNKKKAIKDKRNSLINEYLRFVEYLMPISIMLENVPGIENYILFKKVVKKLKKLGYSPQYKVLDVSKYGVPQRRKRLVLMGSLLQKIEIPIGNEPLKTVRQIIGNLESVETTTDPVHKIFPKHTDEVQKRIEQTPLDGGSRKDLPLEYALECHKKEGVGFNDVYGRLRWDDVSSTITGGCLNPSKGRFLHPIENRCISAREAALLQTFPRDYIFPVDIPKSSLALMIGNALPPAFCFYQSNYLKGFLDEVFFMDIYDQEKRSSIMKKVKNKNTAPELYVRKLLTSLGYRYRLKTKELNCNPDIVFTKKKKAIFINGCFWHGHSCKRGGLPKTNHEFWLEKIKKNEERDIKNYIELESKEWKYLIVWQCEIKEKNIINLIDKLKKFLDE